jgi:hypothetical protein
MIVDETSTNGFVCKKCGSAVRIIEHGNGAQLFVRSSRILSGKPHDYQCTCTLKRFDPFSFYLGYCRGRGIVPNIPLYEHHGLPL